MKDDGFYKNREHEPSGYSWENLQRITNIVFIGMAALFVYLGCTSHNPKGQVFLFCFAAYLVGILFYINRSRKNMIRGLGLTAAVFVFLWVYITYFGQRP